MAPKRRAHCALRKPEIAGKACSGIRAPRLKMIIPIVVSAELEAVADVGSTSNAEYLAAFEIADTREIAGPDIPGIRINFSRLSEQGNRNDCDAEKNNRSKQNKF